MGVEKDSCPIGSARVIQLIHKEPCPSFAEIATTIRYGIGSCWEVDLFTSRRISKAYVLRMYASDISQKEVDGGRVCTKEAKYKP